MGSTRIGPVVIALAYVVLAVVTWGTWPDVLIDFGRELYLPWRITAGEVLYRDLASFSGPLSPYVNALWFTLFGVSVRALFIGNLLLLAATTALLHELLRRIADRFTAAVACLLFLGVFAFGQLTAVGNYNYVAPYAHELTHGVLLGLAGLAAAMRWRRSRQTPWLIAAGLCAGFALLTKPEVAIAVAAGIGVVVGEDFVRLARPAAGAQRRIVASIFAGAVALPPAAAVLLLLVAMPFSEALASVATPWRAVAASDALSLEFYRRLMGIEQPLANAVRMLAWTGIGCVALAPAVLLARRPNGSARHARLGAIAVFGAYALLPLLMREQIPWLELGRPLPLVVGLILLFALRQVARSGAGTGTADTRERFVLAAGLAAFALLLLAKIALNAQVSHYGFALAMPAAVLTVCALGAWLPNGLDRAGRRGGLLRAAVAGLVVAFTLAHLAITVGWHRHKNVVVGTQGDDAFRADARGARVKRVLAELAATAPDETFAVLPEGVTLNFLARRATSVPYTNFMPLEVQLFGEAAMRDAFERRPPDRVVLVHKKQERGVPVFGRDYGLALTQWLRDHYEARPPIGAVPFGADDAFGIQVWERRARETP